MKNHAYTILKILNNNGHEAYLVGGCVRDKVLGLDPKDYDICTSASVSEIQSLFEEYKCIMTGAKHGTVTVGIDHQFVEITTFNGKNLKEDLSHRDFTMNSMAMDKNGNIIDFYNGKKDIQNKKIQCINIESLREDSLRMLRAVRFQCKYGFDIDDNIQNYIKEHSSLLKTVSPERIQSELTQILVLNPLGIHTLFELGLLNAIDENLYNMFLCEQNNPHHFTNVGMHTVYALKAFWITCNSLSYFKKKTISYALLLHDVGKIQCKTTDDRGDHFYGHSEYSVQLTEEFLNQYKFSNAEKKRILTLIQYHDYQFSKKKRTLRKILIVNRLYPEVMKSLFIVKRADALAHVDGEKKVSDVNEFEKYFTENIDSLIYRLQDLEINGNDVLQNTNLNGKSIRLALKECLDLVFYHPEKNTKEYLMEYVKRNERRFYHAGK